MAQTNLTLLALHMYLYKLIILWQIFLYCFVITIDINSMLLIIIDSMFIQLMNIKGS